MLELDKNTFEEEVLKAEGYVLVEFYGERCIPCQVLMPHFHAMEEAYGDKLKFTALNAMQERSVAIGQKVLGVPVVAIYKDGEKVEELIKDNATEDAVEELVKKYYALA